MEGKKRVEQIRKANELFNNGEILKAQEIYLQVNYTDGLLRIAEHYYDSNKPLFALPFYKKAGAKSKVEEIEWRMIAAMKAMVEKSTPVKESDEIDPKKNVLVKESDEIDPKKNVLVKESDEIDPKKKNEVNSTKKEDPIKE
jgi:hypothetical protein